MGDILPAARELLRVMQPVHYISNFGRELIDRGVVARSGKKVSPQGAALLAGGILRRLQQAGMAKRGAHGEWKTTIPQESSR